ncbi:YkgJ family cysteine cluster protein [bacterium]|nr:YkgJ family cysteine cluster protein [bacterium]
MINNYIAYLEFITEKLNNFFEQQKEYIFCKKGCSKCCENAIFPYSQMEITFLLAGTLKLDIETQMTIDRNIKNVLEQKKEFKGEKFYYTCPFLINNCCSVYEHRGIICRAFGLMTIGKDEELNAPFCHELGLNYSNVIEDGGKKVSTEKFKKLGLKQEPLAHNVRYSFLTGEHFEQKFGFNFGEKKPLIDWFETNT